MKFLVGYWVTDQPDDIFVCVGSFSIREDAVAFKESKMTAQTELTWVMAQAFNV